MGLIGEAMMVGEMCQRDAAVERACGLAQPGQAFPIDRWSASLRLQQPLKASLAHPELTKSRPQAALLAQGLQRFSDARVPSNHRLQPLHDAGLLVQAQASGSREQGADVDVASRFEPVAHIACSCRGMHALGTVHQGRYFPVWRMARPLQTDQIEAAVRHHEGATHVTAGVAPHLQQSTDAALHQRNRRALQHFAGEICQARALTSGQCDVAAMWPAFEAIHRVRQTG